MRIFVCAVSGVVWVSWLAMACTPVPPPADTLASPPAAASGSDLTAHVAHDPLAGGWSPADPFSPEVQEAARFAAQTFAVRHQSRVLYKEVLQARQQVVAGLNFQLELQVLHDGKARRALATVWRQPDGHYKLSEWVWQDA